MSLLQNDADLPNYIDITNCEVNTHLNLMKLRTMNITNLVVNHFNLLKTNNNDSKTKQIHNNIMEKSNNSIEASVGNEIDKGMDFDVKFQPFVYPLPYIFYDYDMMKEGLKVNYQKYQGFYRFEK